MFRIKSAGNPARLGWLASLCLMLPAAAQTYLPAIPGSVDDTARIELALDACHSRATECTVRLGPGDFRVGPIVVYDFHGKFAGAGAGRTVIRAIPNLAVAFDFMSPLSKTNRYPQLLSFLSGEFTISDMSVRIESYTPFQAYQWLDFLPPSHYSNAILSISQKSGSPAPKAVVEHVELSGADGDAAPWYGVTLPSGYGVNTNTGLFFGAMFLSPPMTAGSLVVRDSEFKHTMTGIFSLKSVATRIQVSGNRVSESIGAVAVYLASESDVKVMENTCEAWQSGMHFLQSPNFDLEGWGPARASNFHIMHNNVRVTQIADIPVAGIRVQDDYTGLAGEQPRLEAIIGQNSVLMSGPTAASPRYGIHLLTTAATIAPNNEVKGSGTVALAVEGATNCHLLSPDLLSFRASKAHLWLSTASRGCLAAGLAPGLTVLDQGTSNKLLGPWKK